MGLVIFGGVRRIASVTQTLVPIMALLYLLLGVVIVAMHIERLPGVFATIFLEAFGPNEVVGAALGYIILTGVFIGLVWSPTTTPLPACLVNRAAETPLFKKEHLAQRAVM